MARADDTPTASTRDGTDMEDVPLKYQRGKPVNARKIVNPNTRSRVAYREKVIKEAQRSAAAVDAWLRPSQAGSIEAEGLERTWKFRQEDIVEAAPVGARSKAFDLDLADLGPYQVDCSRDGRHVLLGGKKGHLALFDRLSFSMTCEVQVRETVRAVALLHSSSFFAASQKDHTYIYDKRGIEVHRLERHARAEALGYLPHHFLLASVGPSPRGGGGEIAWQDTSTGQVVATAPTKGGFATSLAAAAGSGVLAQGSADGTVSLWTPNFGAPVARVLAHHGAIRSLAWSSDGRHLVTAGADARVRVFDVRTMRGISSYDCRAPVASVAVSQRGMVAVGWSRKVQVFSNLELEGPPPAGADPGDLEDPSGSATPPPPPHARVDPYLSRLLPTGQVQSLAFVPYDDALLAGAARGLSSLLVPGAGEPNYDSWVADPYGGKKARREAEVRGLLDKVPSSMIVLDPSSIGAIAPLPAEAAAELRAARLEAQAETRRAASEKIDQRTKMKGKNKPTRRQKRKQTNIIEERKAGLVQRIRDQGLTPGDDGARAKARARKERERLEREVGVPRALRRFLPGAEAP